MTRLALVAARLAPVTGGLAPVATGLAPVTARLAQVTAGLAPVTAGLALVTARLAPVTAGLAPVTARLAPVSAGLAPVTAGLAPVIAPSPRPRGRYPTRVKCSRRIATLRAPFKPMDLATPALHPQRGASVHREHFPTKSEVPRLLTGFRQPIFDLPQVIEHMPRLAAGKVARRPAFSAPRPVGGNLALRRRFQSL